MKNEKLLQSETDLAAQIVALMKDRGIGEYHMRVMNDMIRGLNFACFVFFIDYARKLLDEKKQECVNAHAKPKVVRIYCAQDNPLLHCSREYSIYDALEKYLMLLRALYTKDGNEINKSALVVESDNIRFLTRDDARLNFPASESFKSLIRDASVCASLINQLSNVIYISRVSHPLLDSYRSLVASQERLFRMMRDIERDRVDNKHYCSEETSAVISVRECLDVINATRSNTSVDGHNLLNNIIASTEKLRSLCKKSFALVYARSSEVSKELSGKWKGLDRVSAIANEALVSDMAMDMLLWEGLGRAFMDLNRIVKSADSTDLHIQSNYGDLKFLYDKVRQSCNGWTPEVLDQCVDMIGRAGAFMQVASHFESASVLNVLDDAAAEAIVSMNEEECSNRCCC